MLRVWCAACVSNQWPLRMAWLLQELEDDAQANRSVCKAHMTLLVVYEALVRFNKLCLFDSPYCTASALRRCSLFFDLTLFTFDR